MRAPLRGRCLGAVYLWACVAAGCQTGQPIASPQTRLSVASAQGSSRKSSSMPEPIGPVISPQARSSVVSARRSSTSGPERPVVSSIRTKPSVVLVGLQDDLSAPLDSPFLPEAMPTSVLGHCATPPRELAKVSLPTYIIEPPDILLIEVDKYVRLPTDPLEPLDQVLVRVRGTFPQDEKEDELVREFKTINGIYRINNDGTLDLGPIYGSVAIAGLTPEQARSAIEDHLKRKVTAPQVSLSLPESPARQQISGEHLVQPDGTVALGIYGDVHVVGLTRVQAKDAIEKHLAGYMLSPRVDVSVYAYNSKVYYVITDGGGYGEQVYRFPVTGNETVLDAISLINGLPPVASKKHIWIARPSPETGGQQVLPVDWQAIAQGGSGQTNYQVLPGDRIYVKADHWIALDSFVAKVTSPFERLFGFTLLGNRTVRDLQFGHRGIGGTGN